MVYFKYLSLLGDREGTEMVCSSLATRQLEFTCPHDVAEYLFSPISQGLTVPHLR